MFKKKIVVLVIVIVSIVGLVWFFWPKKSYVYGGATYVMYIKDCDCLGIENKENKIPKSVYAEGAFERYCYGIVHNCSKK